MHATFISHAIAPVTLAHRKFCLCGLPPQTRCVRRLPVFRLLTSPMALPRWIDDSTCDSPAMLTAYLDYHLNAEQSGVRICSFTDLYMVVHRPADAPPPSLCLSGKSTAMSTRPCTVPLCKRCEEGRGGYMFRWYYPRWEAVYLQERRKGLLGAGLGRR